jgi:hypothetical protein
MTRLRIAERRVLDALVNAGVANSHSEALSWCVSFVSKNEKAWLSDLRDAFKTIEKKRRDGPKGKESWSDRKLRHDLRICPPPPRPLILVSVDLRRDGSRNSLPLW